MKRNTIEGVMSRLIIREPTDLPTGCWDWPGRRCTGHYGQISMAMKLVMIHRVVYEHLRGPVPDGLELDHQCRNRICANPDHLRLVTREQNIGNPQPYTVPPRIDLMVKGKCTHGQRRVIDCILCQRERGRRFRERQRELHPPKGPQTHCLRGHPFEGANLRIYQGKGKKGSQRYCRACDRIRAKRKRDRS